MPIYDRREWSIGFLIFGFCFISFMTFLNKSRFREPSIMFLTALFLNLFMIADFGSLRITLTKSELKIVRGFFFYRRTIRYDEIVGITYGKILNADLPKVKREFFKAREFAAGSNDPVFKIDLKDGNFCLIQSQNFYEAMKLMNEIGLVSLVKKI